MRHDAYLGWGWSPQYLLASRWEPPADGAQRVDHGHAAAIVERLARSDPGALRSAWLSTGVMEPERVRAMSIEELGRRLAEDLERPTGRLGLYERHTGRSLGRLASDLDVEIIDLLTLADGEDEP
ncbi:MAG: hypothetical protein H6712_27225 [Myxococcales bacterium]|nr:hypothetical protein [Myxococcales bacterium]MCB9717570.1 hypothetical protein [Myxococcales bacterium]